jgi:hypothetical protein
MRRWWILTAIVALVGCISDPTFVQAGDAGPDSAVDAAQDH